MKSDTALKGPFISKKRGGDCPVVFWDFELVETVEDYCPLFSSVSAMLRCLTVAAEQNLNIFYHYPEDPHETSPVRKQLLKRFIEEDPQPRSKHCLRLPDALGCHTRPVKSHKQGMDAMP